MDNNIADKIDIKEYDSTPFISVLPCFDYDKIYYAKILNNRQNNKSHVAVLDETNINEVSLYFRNCALLCNIDDIFAEPLEMVIKIYKIKIKKGSYVYMNLSGDLYVHNYDIIEEASLFNVDTLTELFNRGANIPEYSAVLIEPCSTGDFDAVKLLVEHGANINAAETQALREASEAGHFEIVKYLIEHGANLTNNCQSIKYAKTEEISTYLKNKLSESRSK